MGGSTCGAMNAVRFILDRQNTSKKIHMEYNTHQIEDIVAHIQECLPNRKMGVEIECYIKSDSLNAVRCFVESKGVSIAREGYNHSVREHWKIVTDASLSAPQGYVAYEFVSPPLESRDMFNQLHVICEALNVMGDAKINKHCGVHVHHDARKGYTWRRLRNLVYLYAKSERALDQLVAPSRRGQGCTWCNTVKDHLDSLVREGSVTNCQSWRYKKLNLQSFIRQGTVEYRHHGGTTDYSKLVWWVALTFAIHQRGKKVVKRTDGYDNPLINVMLQIGWAKWSGKSITPTSEGAKHLLEYTNERLRGFDFTPLPLVD